ncbi:MAG: hemin uptake protein HemP [Burkholderiales bacterium]
MTEPAATPTDRGARGDAPLQIQSEQLFAGRSEVRIVHQGSVYRLKRTALDKLILTK